MTGRVTQWFYRNMFFTRGVTAALLVLSVVGASNGVASASFFSFFGSGTTEQAYAVAPATPPQQAQPLRAARNLDPNPARGGGGPIIAQDSALVAQSGLLGADATTVAQPPSSDQIALYLVQDGDTLSQVAAMFGVSVNTIIWANELSSSKDIHPGETLLILPINGVQHTVVKGDTVGGLAKKYGGDADEILTYNGLPNEAALTVGMVVTIPGGEVPVVKHAPKSGSAPVRTATKSGGPDLGGYFINPLPGSVKTQGLHGYNAVDLAAACGKGSPIRAAASGRVIVARVGGWNGGYGNYVVIDHPNGTQTLYAHQSSIIVWQGQSVVQGQVIGYVGNTGRVSGTTGCHLHVEVRGARNPF